MNQLEQTTKRIRKIAHDIADIAADIENNKSRTNFFADLIKQRVFEIYDLTKDLVINDSKDKEPHFLKNKTTGSLFRTENDALQQKKEAITPIKTPESTEPKIEEVIIPINEEKIDETKKPDEVKEEKTLLNPNIPIEEVKEVSEPIKEPIEEISKVLNEPVKTAPLNNSNNINSPSWLNQLLEETIEKNSKSHDITQRLQNTPIGDLTKSISIGQKHEFISGLFAGDSNVFKQTLEKVQNCDGINPALKILEGDLADQYQWQKKEKLVAEFLFLVQRRFL